MFTVMCRAGDGVETLYTATTVRRAAHKDGPSVPACGDVILTLPPGDYPFPSGENGAEIVIQHQELTGERPFEQMVFVMNKHGATVATYRL